MLRSFGSFAKGLKEWCFFTWFVCVWRSIDGDNRDITFRIGSNYLWMCEICWSSKNSTNQPSPKLRWSSKNHPPIVVLEVGDDPPWGDLWFIYLFFAWWKAPFPQRKYRWTIQRILYFNLSAAIWLWPVTAVYVHFWSYLFDSVCRSVATLCLMVVLFV